MLNPSLGLRVPTILLLAAPLTALQGHPAPDVQRPAGRYLRQDEDWSTLRDVDRDALGWDDRIKFVPWNEDGSVWATFGGHVRVRMESWNHFLFQPNDDQLVLSRVVPYADVHLGGLRLFGEVLAARVSNRDLPGGARGIDQNDFDVLQLFAEVSLPVVDGTETTLRAGRETLDFGRGRLVGPAPFGRNIPRAWNGASLRTEIGGWDLTGFWGELVIPVEGKFDRAFDDRLWGLYGTTFLGESAAGLDSYLLGRELPDGSYNGTTGGEERYTTGARLFRRPASRATDYDVEAAYQFGRIGTDDVGAFMVAAEGGYTFDGAAAPRVRVGFDYGSGDSAAGGRVEGFDQLFPRGHAHLGFNDLVARQNILAAHLGVTARPHPKLTLGATVFTFRLDERGDALYNTGGAAIVPAGVSDAKDVGKEIDLTVTATLDRHTRVLLGFSRFFGGGLQRDAGLQENVSFLYLSLAYSL